MPKLGYKVKVPGHRSVGCVLIAMVFAACGSSPQPADTVAAKETPAAKSPIVARFDCDTLALTATFHDDQALIEIPEQRARTLPRVVSASGARYSNGSDTFWNKGREATLELNGRTEMCRERREPWQEAADRGVDFRAVGQEPGWFLEIDKEKQIRLIYDYAEHQVTTPVPPPSVKGTSTIYDAMVESHRLTIVIEDVPCTDAMSGEAFPRSVSVTLDSKTLRGCGKFIFSDH
ncbi:MAG TPA: MliC family protein [Vicinamibacterales bacterium]|nr:MliC family protein [Vicinamibacterales bacterium]